MRRFLGLALATLALLSTVPADAAPKKEFKVCWSIYVGWMPWGHLQSSGIMKKWADKYGISVDVVQINDYVESINQYTAGAFDGCAMTNMDALSIPAAGGVDTTALIVGDYSNGNDGIVLKGKKALADIKGQKVNLVELSVSHFLLARALEGVKLSEKDITVVNTSDADIVAAYSTPDVTAAVTWNPLLADVKAAPDSTEVFDSSSIPGEIIDVMMVNTATLKDNPNFGKALVGAWYEMMALMTSGSEAGIAAKTEMAKASGTDLAGFDSQLKTTQMFFKPADAVAFTKDGKLPTTMQFVAKFLFDHGILGQGATGPDFVGVEFAGGKVVGDKSKVNLRFDPTYMEMAAAGKL
jgi:NitT/TauT family transport system substrate-binding protein